MSPLGGFQPHGGEVARPVKSNYDALQGKARLRVTLVDTDPE